MRLFGSDRLSGVISRLGLKEGDAIEHSLITKQIERAQRRVEANNFSIRKHLLEYDDVMNKQREVIYAKRLLALESSDISDEIRTMIEAVVNRKIDKYVPKGSQAEDWDLAGLKRDLESTFAWRFEFDGGGQGYPRAEAVEEGARATAIAAYEAKQKEVGYEVIKSVERGAMLYVIDSKWRDHLYDLDSVKSGIGLRAYGQKDPLVEYKAEAYDLFVKMIDEVEDETVALIFHGRWVRPPEEAPRRQARMREVKPDIVVSRGAADGRGAGPERVPGPVRAAAGARPAPAAARVGRNDPCPCGSGKKYKKCCGK
jgi:preprotein translocase subunit SecA